MKRKWMILSCICVLFFMIAACGRNTAETENKTEVYVLAAASMTDVMSEMKTSYEEKHPDVDLKFSFASSGDLQTQIEEGAPADLFISAAKQQMDDLKRQGLMEDDSIIDLLENKVVLIKQKNSDLDMNSFEDVATDKVEMVAIGNPESVPVGQYTKSIYESLNLWDKIEKKLNLGKDVRQVLDWVATKNADCGIVYATDAAIEDKVEVVCEAPTGSCDPAIYPAGIIRDAQHKEEAQEFLNYLKTEEAKKVFENYQFTYLYQE